MEVVGIDNLIFISILTNKLPEHQQVKARASASNALVLRLALLGTIAFIVQLTQPLHRFRPSLLLARPDPDRRRPLPRLEGDEGDPPQRRSGSRGRRDSPKAARLTFGSAIGQIILLDIVFSLDSIITAVGMTDDLPIMVIAVVTWR